MIKVSTAVGDEIKMMGELWDYIEQKVGKSKVNNLMKHLGLDNPHFIQGKSLDELKMFVDKFLTFNKILGGNEEK